MRPAAVAVAVLLVAITVACYGLTDNEWARVQVWLHCDDCDSTVLAYVDSLGNARERETLAVLGRALENGPSEKQRANMRSKLAGSWRMIEGQVDPELTLDQYVRHYEANYVATYQIRAAEALGAIGSAKAVELLREAVEQSPSRAYRDDVTRYVGVAYASAAYDEYGGTVSSPASFLEPVRVLPDVDREWTGSETVVVPGAAFADATITSRWGRDSLEFVAGAWPGRYQVLVTGTPSEDSLRAPLIIRTKRYTPHNRSSPLDLGVLEARQRLFSALTGYLPDDSIESIPRGSPTDHFEIRTRVDTLVLAIVDWTGGATVQPTWFGCAAGDSSGAGAMPGPRVPSEVLPSSGGDPPRYLLQTIPPDTVTRPDTTSVLIPAGGCRVLRLAKQDLPDEPALVELDLRPVPVTRRVETHPAGPVRLRTGDRGSVRLSLSTFDHRGRRVYRPVAWRSEDPSVVSVSQTGLLTAAGRGSTRVFAFTSGQSAAVIQVQVER